MRAKIKKGIMLLLAAVLLCSVTVGLMGCDEKDRYTEDFVYRVYLDSVEIMKLTEVGKTKEVLVIPVRIGNKKVQGCYDLKSDKLKKIYIPFVEGSVVKSRFESCINLEKIICYQRLTSIIYTPNNEKKSTKTYIRRGKGYEDIEEGSNWATEKGVDFDEMGIVGCYYANVRYVFVNNNGEIVGHCWLDDYDYGSKITYIPSNVAKYSWYKDPECKNKWDFEVDTLPEEVVKNGVVQYQETILYAKWGINGK